MPQLLKNTLYLLSPGLYLHRDHLALRIEENKLLKLSLPIHNVESILIFGNTMVSPSAMRLCWENQVPISFLTEYGRFEARVEGLPQGSVLLRRRQHQTADSKEDSLHIARSMIAGKLQNTRWLLLRTAREAQEPDEEKVLRKTTGEIDWLLQNLPSCPDVETARGMEGQGAATAFDQFPLHLKSRIRDKFPFSGRNRRPPRDSINCLLSFLYALLRHDCVAALAATGLDPFVGYLHADRAGRESLALDLMEEFRPWTDRLAITLLNRGEILPTHFHQREGGAVELKDSTRKTVVNAYQQRKREQTRHPLFKQKVIYGQLPFIQARILAQHLRGDLPTYLPHLFN